ncbi:Flagellar biosynthesis protein [gamma proteobacterium HdN1]|nr:Flagellar biosynthesis protein [gamma proteobacterium HdN1]
MANVTPKDAQKLKSLLQHQVNAANATLEQLKYEREALEQRNFDGLSLLQKTKHQHLSEVNDLEVARQSLMQTLELDLGQEGFDTFCEQLPSPWRSPFALLWDERKTLLQRCRTANEINGRILNHTQQASDRIMALFRGQANAQYVYTAKGGRGYVQTTRQLAVA